MPGRLSGIQTALACKVTRRGQACDAFCSEDGPHYGLLDDPRSPRAHDVGRHLHPTCRRGEDDIAVHSRVNRVYGAGESVVAHLGDLADLRLGEARVGGHDPQGGTLTPTQTGSSLWE